MAKLGPDQAIPRPFRTTDEFVTTLLHAHAAVTGVSPIGHRFSTEENSIIGRIRPDAPDSILFQPPRPGERPLLIEELRVGATRVENPEERARLVHLGIQLIHPWQDGNGRAGRVMFAALRRGEPVALGELARIAREDPLAREGAARAFGKHSAHSLEVTYNISRMILGPQMIGMDLAKSFLGIGFLDLDRMSMEEKARFAVTLDLGRGFPVEELASHLFASQAAFSPFKLALISHLRRDGDGTLERLARVSSSGSPRTLEFPDAASLLRSMSPETVASIMEKCWECSTATVRHLVNAFAYPDQYPRFGAGGAEIGLKDLWASSRLPLE